MNAYPQEAIMDLIRTTTPVRCSESVTTTHGRTVTCGAFLAEVNPKYIRFRCHKCKAEYLVTAVGDGLKTVRLPPRTVLGQNKE